MHMGKRRFTEQSWRSDPWFQALVSSFMACKTREETENFLRDIGTLAELQAWGERLEVAKQLSRGLSYRQVAANTGASTTTVTRVAKFLENGEGGYRKILKKDVPTKEEESKDLTPTEQLIERRKKSVLEKYL